MNGTAKLLHSYKSSSQCAKADVMKSVMFHNLIASRGVLQMLLSCGMRQSGVARWAGSGSV